MDFIINGKPTVVTSDDMERKIRERTKAREENYAAGKISKDDRIEATQDRFDRLFLSLGGGEACFRLGMIMSTDPRHAEGRWKLPIPPWVKDMNLYTQYQQEVSDGSRDRFIEHSIYLLEGESKLRMQTKEEREEIEAIAARPGFTEWSG